MVSVVLKVTEKHWTRAANLSSKASPIDSDFVEIPTLWNKLDDSARAGVSKSSAVSGQLIVGDSTNSTFRGPIISANSLALEKVGSGKLTLTGANTYTNGTTITGGELEVSSQSPGWFAEWDR
jgi:autotransporter-associated beta strand protein